MASYRKRGKSWAATIERIGHRPEHKTLPTKAQAVAWATRREAELLAGKRGQITQHTVLEALKRYSAHVAPTHRGCRWEQVRLAKFERTVPFLGRFCSEVTPADVCTWRDASLKILASSSVRREMVLMRSVFEKARKEWGWLRENPMREIEWPSAGRARSRRVSENEVDAILEKLGYRRGTVAANVSQRVGVAFLWALETGMRGGEIVALDRADVDRKGRYARLDRSKNEDARDVPLSKAAIALLDCLPINGDSLFDISSEQRDALFRKARDAAGLRGLHFHDSRHEAITRMARKLDVLDLARAIGHRDLKSLQVYYNATASEIASRLDD